MSDHGERFLDALDRAFTRLGDDGILTQTGACCSTCACHALADRFEREPEAVGYAFTTRAGRADAMAGRGVHIGFGHGHGEDTGDEAIARQVIAALEAAGLEVIWNGNTGTKIEARLPEAREEDVS